MSDLFALMDATWPPRAIHRAGGFALYQGSESKRLSAGRLCDAEWDIAQAEAGFAHLRQKPLFLLRPEEAALDAELSARGYSLAEKVRFYRAPCEALCDEVAPVRAFAHWPPLEIARDIWRAGGIGAEHQAAMARATEPKTALVGRLNDRAAGAAFVALKGAQAMLHALYILPQARRQSLARDLICEAAAWARAHGAQHLALAVALDNRAAIALYERLGFCPAGDYHYRIKDLP